MAYDEVLALRIRQSLVSMKQPASEKKMFGGIAFMLNDSMAIGIVKDDIMVRTMDSAFDKAMKHPHARPMDFTGKPMRGFLFVSPEGFKSDKQLQDWIQYGIDFAWSAEAAAKKAKKKKAAPEKKA